MESPWTYNLEVSSPDTSAQIPSFRIIDNNGIVVNPDFDPKVIQILNYFLKHKYEVPITLKNKILILPVTFNEIAVMKQ